MCPARRHRERKRRPHDAAPDSRRPFGLCALRFVRAPRKSPAPAEVGQHARGRRLRRSGARAGCVGGAAQRSRAWRHRIGAPRDRRTAADSTANCCEQERESLCSTDAPRAVCLYTHTEEIIAMTFAAHQRTWRRQKFEWLARGVGVRSGDALTSVPVAWRPLTVLLWHIVALSHLTLLSSCTHVTCAIDPSLLPCGGSPLERDAQEPSPDASASNPASRPDPASLGDGHHTRQTSATALRLHLID